MRKTLVVLIVFISLAFLAQSQWKLAKNKDGIQVYLTEASNTGFKKFKVQGFVAAQPEEVARAFTDLNNNYKWLSDVEQAKLIKRISNNEYIYKQVVVVPFPFKNREVVQHCAVSKLANGVIRINLKEENDAIPLDDDYVRMNVAQGFWLLTPQANGTFVQYTYLADPSGNIPAWLANQFMVDSPYETFMALRKYLAN